MKSSNRLFFRSKFRLAIAYASVMGATLLLCGFVAHLLLYKAFNRSVDSELENFAQVFVDKFDSLLITPGQFPSNIDQVLPGLCFIDQPCENQISKSDLFLLLEKGYYLRFLNKSGKAIASTSKYNLTRFPDNLKLLTFYDKRDSQGELYHLHLSELKTNKDKKETWGYVEVGVQMQIYSDYMNTLHLLLVVGVPLAMVLIGVGSWYLAVLAMRPIQQSYEQIQRFTSDAAHELRTPIASAQILIETTLDNPLFLDHQQSLKSIYRQIKRLGNLTADLLLLSRLEQNPLQQLKWERICLNDLVQDVEEELMSMAISAHISLDCDIQVNHLLYIQGNEAEIYRLLINLVTNGIKYTSENGEVIIILKAEYSKAIIIVKDTGIGISQNDIAHIFERFYRVNDDRSRHTGGTGLGLAIAKAIALSHQGSLQVISNVDEGSSFIVILPLFLN